MPSRSHANTLYNTSTNNSSNTPSNPSSILMYSPLNPHYNTSKTFLSPPPPLPALGGAMAALGQRCCWKTTCRVTGMHPLPRQPTLSICTPSLVNPPHQYAPPVNTPHQYTSLIKKTLKYNMHSLSTHPLTHHPIHPLYTPFLHTLTKPSQHTL